MSNPKSLRTNAIVLRRTDFGEADRILKVITPEEGVLSVMAKAVRREKSKLAGGIELFAVCDLNLHLGRTELATLTGARIKTFYSQILLNYGRLEFGYEVLKLIGKTAENVSESEFYNLLQETLAGLNDLKVPLSLMQVWFYLHLANLLGHGLNTATDAAGMNLIEEARYNFDPREAVLVFHEKGNLHSEHIKFLRLLAQNKPTTVARVVGAEQLSEDCLSLALSVAKL